MKEKEKSEERTMRPLLPDAIGRETREVTTKFTEEELADMNERHTEIAFNLDDEEEEFKQVKKDYQNSIKEKKTEMAVLRRDIRKGQTTRAIECDMIPDYGRGIMQFVDAQGVVVDERRLKPGERQKDLAVESAQNDGLTGTHN